VKTNKDTLLARGIITKEQYRTVDEFINYDISVSNGGWLTRADLAFLDIFGTNGFTRPICVASPYAQRKVWPISEYAELTGSIHKFVPYRNPNRNTTSVGMNGINVEKTYDLLMNQFSYGNLNGDKTYIDPESYRTSLQMRLNFMYLAQALIAEGKKDSAVQVIDKCLEVFPNHKILYDRNMVFLIQLLTFAGANDKAVALATTLADTYEKNFYYFERFPNKYQNFLKDQKEESLAVIYNLQRMLASVNAPSDTAAAAKELSDRLSTFLAQQNIL